MLVLMMIASLVPSNVLAMSNTDYRYDLESGGTIYFDKNTGTITDCSQNGGGELIIPEEIDGVKVTCIGCEAFYNLLYTTAIIIPNTVTTIESRAFSYCEKLEIIEIPGSVTSIGSNAFYRCSSLASVIINDGVTSIGSYAFSDCTKLENISIPDSVVFIGEYAFNRCLILPSIVLPNKLSTIAKCTFWECSALVSVTIPASVISIENDAFFRCGGLTNIYYGGTEEQWKAIKNDDATIKTGPKIYSCDNTHIHSCTSTATAPTCTEKGFTTYTCYSCGESYIDDYIDELGHSFTDGVCVRCGYNDPNYVAPHEHNYVSNTIEPTCTSAGYTEYTCSICGEYYVKDYTDATSHKYENGICIICAAKDPNYVEPHSHAYNPIVTLPTCTSIGYTTYTCSCGNSYRDAITDALGHSYIAIVTEPTCVDAGYTTYACKRCGNNYKGDAVQPIGHDYKNGKCTRCDAIDPNYKAPTAVTFSDVAAKAYYSDAVQWAIKNNITNGTDDTHFSPNQGCTRGQVVTFLWRAAGSPTVSGDAGFVDVKSTDYYYDAVKWAVANGITNGTDATHFSPSATCTRGQVVTFMYRAEGSPATSGSCGFVDVKSADYYYNAVIWAVANGITNGTDATHFSPSATCTRAQVVTFLHRNAQK